MIRSSNYRLHTAYNVMKEEVLEQKYSPAADLDREKSSDRRINR